MTVWDNVAFGPRSRKVPKAEIGRRVEEMLAVVRLDDFAGRKPSQLSGGQQQRVALARALVNYPSALLLDEPLGALDLKLRQIMQFELKRIQRDVGITFVYVTHDQEEALTMSDRIAVMNAGRVEQIGTPIDIYARPASVFVAGFIGQANLWPCRVVGAAAPTGDGASAFDVDVLGTTLPSACGDVRIEVGGSATLMVRPERVRVTTDEPTGPGTVAATVTDLTFQGPLVRLSLAAADGSPIVAQLGHEVDLPLLRPGDRVWASWPADASLVLRAGADVHPGRSERRNWCRYGRTDDRGPPVGRPRSRRAVATTTPAPARQARRPRAAGGRRAGPRLLVHPHRRDRGVLVQRPGRPVQPDVAGFHARRLGRSVPLPPAHRGAGDQPPGGRAVDRGVGGAGNAGGASGSPAASWSRRSWCCRSRRPRW